MLLGIERSLQPSQTDEHRLRGSAEAIRLRLFHLSRCRPPADGRSQPLQLSAAKAAATHVGRRRQVQLSVRSDSLRNMQFTETQLLNATTDSISDSSFLISHLFPISPRLPYKDIFGGVSALTRDQMQRVNGFSNEFWGWGGEDDDM